MKYLMKHGMFLLTLIFGSFKSLSLAQVSRDGKREVITAICDKGKFIK